MQDLQSQLERLDHEKSLLEARIVELLPYQGEVGKLKAELLKMQVGDRVFVHKNFSIK